MSGTFNIMLASFSGNAPQGFLAAISNSNGSSVTNPRIAIRNDQLNLALTSLSALSEQQFTVLRLDLGLSAITWQTSLTNAPDLPVAYAIKLDSAGNAVVAGATTVSPSSTPNAFAAKFNSSGVLQWQRRINNNSAFFTVAIDGSDNIYCAGVGRFISAAGDDIYVAKFDSTGALIYQRTIGDTGTSYDEFARDMALIDTYFALAAFYDGPSVQSEAEFYLGKQADGTAFGAANYRAANGTSSINFQGIISDSLTKH
jgi:hypothetical protein